MDTSTLKFIQDNVPDASKELIHETYQKLNQDVLETISFLLNIPVPPKKEQTEWEKRRQIFDDCDQEMQKLLQAMKQQPPRDPNEPPPQKRQK
jgi:hypothetical protein